MVFILSSRRKLFGYRYVALKIKRKGERKKRVKIGEK